MRIVPSNFYADPLGYLGNHGGHIMLGITFTYWFAWGWKLIGGELPAAILCALVWASVYLVIEFSQKGSGILDRAHDIAVSVIYPTAVALWAKEAFAAAPWLFDALLPIFAIYTADMSVGGGIRLWQAHKEGRDL